MSHLRETILSMIAPNSLHPICNSHFAPQYDTGRYLDNLSVSGRYQKDVWYILKGLGEEEIVRG